MTIAEVALASTGAVRRQFTELLFSRYRWMRTFSIMTSTGNWYGKAGVALGLAVATIGIGLPAGAAPDRELEGAGADPVVAENLELASDGITVGFETIPAPNAPGSCEITVLAPIFAQPDCTLFASQFQAPPGENVIRSVSVFAGPNPGPMRFDVLQASRSQSGAGGIVCCVSVAQSPVVVPVPNQVNTFQVSLPFNNRVIDIEGERVEVIDQLAISVLAPGTSLPLVGDPGLPLMSVFNPSVRPGELRILSSAVTFPFAGGAIPTISAIACPTDGSGTDDVCQTVGEPGESFTGVNPSRQLDTRSSGRVAAGSTTSVQIGGVGGVPTDATAAVLNVTAVAPSDEGFLTVFPCGETRPGASNVNFRAGQTVANAAVATIGDGGEVCVYSSAETNLLVDVNGAVTGGFAGLNPDRLLDTRSSGRVDAGSTTRVRIAGQAGVPSGAIAAVLNVTAVNPLEKGFLTVFPCGESRPDSSNVNFEARRNVPNAVVATLGDDGEVCVFSSVATNLLVDLNGAVSTGFAGLVPDRLLDTRSSGRVDAGSTTRVRIAGQAGVPSGAVAAVLNVTAVAPSDGGFLTVFPCGESQPGSSNVNFGRGATVANAAVATLGENGEVCIFSSVETNLLVDVNGAFT